MVAGLDGMNPNSQLFVRVEDAAEGKGEQWPFLIVTWPADAVYPITQTV